MGVLEVFVLELVLSTLFVFSINQLLTGLYLSMGFGVLVLVLVQVLVLVVALVLGLVLT